MFLLFETNTALKMFYNSLFPIFEKYTMNVNYKFVINIQQRYGVRPTVVLAHHLRPTLNFIFLINYTPLFTQHSHIIHPQSHRTMIFF